MDYLRLKKTLIAAFDHFLSCHDMHDLEEMMQAFEAGKSLVIGFPEPIHREDYSDDIKQKDDAFTREVQKDDVLALDVSKPKKVTSRIKKKKPKAVTQTAVQKHIATVPIFIDLSNMNKEKQAQISNILQSDNHNIVLSDVMIKTRHAFGLAKISSSSPSPLIGLIKKKIKILFGRI